MTSNRRNRVLTACVMLAGSLVLAGATVAHAQSVWDGGGAHANWMTASNWEGDILPTFGRNTDLLFGTGFASGITLQTNGKQSVGQLFIDAVDDFTITGDGIVIHDGRVTRSADSAGFQTIAAGIRLRKDGLILNNSAEGELDLTGEISGGRLTIDGPGSTLFGGTHTNRYRGATYVNGGTLILDQTLGVALPGDLFIGDGEGRDIVGLLDSNQIADKSTVTVRPTGELYINNQTEVIHRLLIDGGFVSVGEGSLQMAKPLKMTGGELFTSSLGQVVVRDKVITLASDTTAFLTGGTMFVEGRQPKFRVADGAAATDLSVSAVLDGLAGLLKTGRGLLELTQFNDYFGTTEVRRGTLRLSGNGTPGLIGDITEVSRNAILQLDSANIGGELLMIYGQGADRNGVVQNIGGTSTWSGIVVMGGGVSLGADLGTELILSGTIVGNGGLRKQNQGVLTLSGETANAYKGKTFVNEGTLVLSKSSGLLAVPGNVVIGDGEGDDRLELQASDQMPNRARVQVNSSGTLVLHDEATQRLRAVSIDQGSVAVGRGTLRVDRGFNLTGGNASLDDSGVLELGGNFRSHGADTTAIVAGGIVNLNGRDRKFIVANGQPLRDLVMDCDITNGSLTKDGDGRLQLSGTNTYEGATTVKSGTLEIVGTLNDISDIDVGSGAMLVVNGEDALNNQIFLAGGSRLGGSGQIASNLRVAQGATLAPGNSPGTLSVSNLVLLPDAILDFELSTPGVVGSGVNDLVRVGGLVTGDGALYLDGTLNVIGLSGFDSGTYTLFTYTGTLTDNGLEVGEAPTGLDYTIDLTSPGEVLLQVALAVGSQPTDNYSQLSQVMMDYGSTFGLAGTEEPMLQVIPEPGTMLLTVLGGCAMLRRRARR